MYNISVLIKIINKNSSDRENPAPKLEGHGEDALSRNLSSEMLPRSDLGDYLEERVNQLVKKEGKEEEIGKIRVRCVYNKIQYVKVKEKMTKR